MPYRTFADDQGRSWDIWEVRPDHIERRGPERRQEPPRPWTGPERRASPDRRQQREVRVRLQYPLSEGWLVFQSDEEKRRLCPIPEDWESCRGPRLRQLWQKAEVIGIRRPERSA